MTYHQSSQGPSTHRPTNAAENLAAVLERENAALAALDLQRAAGMLAEKQHAAAAFAAPEAGAGAPSPELALRLRDLAQENQARLEHAIAVQRRIVGIFARAVRSGAASPRYGATGAITASRSTPFTLSARA
jgi:hypothetical protein